MEKQEPKGTRSIDLIKPNLPVENVMQILEKLYYIKIKSIQKLDSYLDQNFKVECIENNYVFKIINSDVSKDTKFIDTTHRLLFHLKNKNVRCPVPIFCEAENSYNIYFNNNNEHIKKECLNSEDKFYLGYLLYYLPGKSLTACDIITEKLLFEIGEFTARLDLAFLDFYEPDFGEYKNCWNLRQIQEHMFKLETIQDEDRRLKLKGFIEDFINNVLNGENNKHIRKGLIHGDVNDGNLLIDPDTLTVSGIIDFGDVCYSFPIINLSTCVLYMMLDGKSKCNLPYFEIAGHIIAGYLSEFKINRHEFEVIIKCIKARVAQSIMNASSFSNINNDPYIMATTNKSWAFLDELNNSTEEFINKYWSDFLESKYTIRI